MTHNRKINEVLRKVASSLPMGGMLEAFSERATNNLAYKPYLNRIGLKQSDLLIIATIARSGTHYMMLLLANYIKYLEGDSKNIDPSIMNEMFPNNWHLSYMNYHNMPFGPFQEVDTSKPYTNNNLINVLEITRSHAIFKKYFWKNSNVIHLYRNPLDYSVSLFNYKYKKRENSNKNILNPGDVLELKYINYVQMYKSYLNASKNGSFKLFRLSYEELICNPIFYLDSIIRWLGLEPDSRGIEFSVESSSIKKTQESEIQGSIVNPTAQGLVGSFIESGKIGQWKKYYNDEDFYYWAKKFSNDGIDLKSFRLE